MSDVKQSPPVFAPTSSNGYAVASLVLGILSVLTCWLLVGMLFALPASLIGFVLGIVGYNRAKRVGRGRTMAAWGVVLCTLPALLLGVNAILAAAE